MKKILTILFLLGVCCVSAQDRDMKCDTVQSANRNQDDVYSAAGLQVQPEFPGGWDAFSTYFKANFKNKKIKDVKDQSSIKVFVSFTIEKDGSTSDIKIMRSVSEDAGEETVKVLEKMPKWSPGVQNDKPVRTRMTLPLLINFTE